MIADTGQPGQDCQDTKARKGEAGLLGRDRQGRAARTTLRDRTARKGLQCRTARTGLHRPITTYSRLLLFPMPSDSGLWNWTSSFMRQREEKALKYTFLSFVLGAFAFFHALAIFLLWARERESVVSVDNIFYISTNVTFESIMYKYISTKVTLETYVQVQKEVLVPWIYTCSVPECHDKVPIPAVYRQVLAWL
jgi:hypothetical protein